MSTPTRDEILAVLPEQRFVEPVTGPAYRPVTRVLAVLIVASLMVYGAQVLTGREAVNSAVLMLMAAAAGVVLITAWYILTGKTTVDATGIRQDWFWERHFRWHEIMRARFVRVPLAPRLVLMTPRGPMKSVHSGNRALDAAFTEIDRFYRAANRSS
jgi:hypothetical protein